MDNIEEKLREELEQQKEDLFLSQSDLDYLRTENTALKNFIQNIYESCEGLEETDLSLADLIKNLKENIRVFSKDNNIRL